MIGVRLTLAALALAAFVAPPARAAFPATPPNDPNYAPGPACTPKLSGEWWLFSTIPSQCSQAKDPENAAGMSVDSAWRDFSVGDPGTVIAYVEGGVNFRLASAKDIVDKIHLNTGELPLPERADHSTCSTYDCNGDGVVNVEDYAQDPRLQRPYHNGYLTPEDLVIAFGHCRIAAGMIRDCPPGGRFDNDHNGYANDIAGWDFVHDTNDVQTDWSNYSHANAQSALAAAATDNGIGGAGVCPRCQLIYVKAGDEALSRPDRQAAAMLYAVDAGAKVIAGEAVTTGYAPVQQQAFDYAWSHGVAVSFDTNDFESTDHTDGMFFGHLLPANSIVQQTNGAGAASFRNRSSLSSWGTHMMLTVPTAGGSTSESVPVQAGLLGLVSSYGRQMARDPNASPGTRGGPLSPAEITQVLIASASRPDDPLLLWPIRPGHDWDIYYGYGRPNAHKALAAIHDGLIPPTADITQPGWYARYDPAVEPGRRVAIKGTVSARRARSATYEVQYALGPEPAPDQFHTLARQRFKGTRNGTLATLSLSAIPASFYARPFRNTGDRTQQTTDLAPEQYAVTVRVRVTDDRGLVGVDRRAIYVQHDPDRLPGFPRRLRGGGESTPSLVDLQGRGETDIVIGDGDGLVHAWRPGGGELPGFPVRTDRDPVMTAYGKAAAYRTVAVPREPIGSPVAIGPLLGDGRQAVVATTPNGRVYAWDRLGHRLAGFPAALDCSPPYPVPSPAIIGHSPQQGAFAAPVLADLNGDGQLEIVQATWDGCVHALRPNGTELPGWPVSLRLPTQITDAAATAAVPGASYFRDAKIIATPAVGNINGEQHPQVIVGSQESIYPTSTGLGERPVYAIHADGNLHSGGPYLSGWPVLVQDTLANVSGGIDFAVTATSNAVLADMLGTRTEQVLVSTTFGYPQAFNASGTPIGLDLGVGRVPSAVNLQPPALGALRVPTGLDLTPTFTSSAAIARTAGGGLQLFWPGSAVGSVLLANVLGGPVVNVMRGWSLPGGAPLPGFPAIQQGLAFFGAPSIASVEQSGVPDVLQTTDSMSLHAFRTTGGGEASGFPKFTGGWSVFAPAIGDLDHDGHTDVVVSTREGYVDAFRTDGPAASMQWCGWQGNARHTGSEADACGSGS